MGEDEINKHMSTLLSGSSSKGKKFSEKLGKFMDQEEMGEDEMNQAKILSGSSSESDGSGSSSESDGSSGSDSSSDTSESEEDNLVRKGKFVTYFNHFLLTKHLQLL